MYPISLLMEPLPLLDKQPYLHQLVMVVIHLLM